MKPVRNLLGNLRQLPATNVLFQINLAEEIGRVVHAHVRLLILKSWVQQQWNSDKNLIVYLNHRIGHTEALCLRYL